MVHTLFNHRVTEWWSLRVQQSIQFLVAIGMFRAILFVLLVKLISDAADATGGLFTVRITIPKYIW